MFNFIILNMSRGNSVPGMATPWLHLWAATFTQRALQGNTHLFHLFQGFVDVKAQKDHHNPQIWSRAESTHSGVYIFKEPPEPIWNMASSAGILSFTPSFLFLPLSLCIVSSFKHWGNASFALLPLFGTKSSTGLVLLGILLFLKAAVAQHLVCKPSHVCKVFVTKFTLIFRRFFFSD